MSPTANVDPQPIRPYLLRDQLQQDHSRLRLARLIRLTRTLDILQLDESLRSRVTIEASLS